MPNLNKRLLSLSSYFTLAEIQSLLFSESPLNAVQTASSFKQLILPDSHLWFERLETRFVFDLNHSSCFEPELLVVTSLHSQKL